MCVTKTDIWCACTEAKVHIFRSVEVKFAICGSWYIYVWGAWWLSGRFGALRQGSNPTLAATYGSWASPSLTVACSTSVC